MVKILNSNYYAAQATIRQPERGDTGLALLILESEAPFVTHSPAHD